MTISVGVEQNCRSVKKADNKLQTSVKVNLA